MEHYKNFINIVFNITSL